MVYPATGDNMTGSPIEFNKPFQESDDRWYVESANPDQNDNEYFYLVSETAYIDISKKLPILVAKTTDPYDLLYDTEEDAYRKLLNYYNYHGLDFPHWNKRLALTGTTITDTVWSDFRVPAGYDKGLITGSRELDLE